MNSRVQKVKAANSRVQRYKSACGRVQKVKDVNSRMQNLRMSALTCNIIGKFKYNVESTMLP